MNQILAVVSESALEGREGIDQVRVMRATAITPGFDHKMHEVVISNRGASSKKMKAILE